MKKLLFILILPVFIVLSSNEAVNANESSSDLYHNLVTDTFPAVEKEGFTNFFNEYFLSTHTPHHNGYDQIYNAEDSQIIEGKFQYGDIRKDLEEEWVSIYLWSFSEDTPSWEKIGRQKTDTDGRISFPMNEEKKLGKGLHLIRLHVEGDSTFTNMYIQVINRNERFVVFDIDGTLTTNDFESFKEYADEYFFEAYRADMYEAANRVVEHYDSEGYNIIYLTARPYWLSSTSQKWLIDHDFPFGSLHTYSGSFPAEDAATYKAEYLSKVINAGGIIDFAYGNALTDIEAYKRIGLSQNQVFIIGENAGVNGTTTVDNYVDHVEALNNVPISF
ncbi:HAD family acid phosphatase [Bacillus spongiae]|uniref:HAD family acid phosphatase n=1 Tax=Bacillus spongiae TaxID=2683610 RepID=A0ABU8HHL3_9BACI